MRKSGTKGTLGLILGLDRPTFASNDRIKDPAEENHAAISGANANPAPSTRGNAMSDLAWRHGAR